MKALQRIAKMGKERPWHLPYLAWLGDILLLHTHSMVILNFSCNSFNKKGGFLRKNI